MSTEKPKLRPKGEGLLDLEGLAERWGMDVEEADAECRAVIETLFP